MKTNKESLLDDLNRVTSTYTIARLIEGKPFDQAWRNDMLHDMLSMMIYHQLIRRFDSVCKDDMTDKVVKTITIIVVGKWLNDTAEEIPQLLIYSVIGTIIYYILIRKPLLRMLSTSLPKFIDPDCVEDWVEDMILTSLNDKSDDILINIATKLVATGIYYHVIKPVVN